MGERDTGTATHGGYCGGIVIDRTGLLKEPYIGGENK
jgi:hypothetical protein